MNDGFPSPGWYTQPHTGAGILHYWDGSVWTGHAQPAPGAVQPTAEATGVTPPGSAPAHATPVAVGAPAYAMPTTQYAGPGRTVASRSNQMSFTTLAVVAFYIALAVATHVALLGIVPLMLSVRAVRRREPLAPVAVVAAVVALVVGVSLLMGR